MSKKILIIDDEESIRDILDVLLSSEDYEIIQADSGESGLELAKVERPDLIILDVMMPRMSGYMVAKHLKLDECLQNIPIVLLTATANVAGNIMLDMPTPYRLTKPFNPDELLEIVKSAFEAVTK